MRRPKPFILLICLSMGIVVLYFRARQTTQGTLDDPFKGLDRASIDLSADAEKRDAVVQSFKHAWNAYRRDAWGYDEYHPLSKKGTNISKSGGIGYTILDAMDTLIVMDLQEEYKEARAWTAEHLSFEKEGKINTFELTIRVLGGLLSSYALSKDELFLEKATDLAERIMPVFDTKSGLPLSFIDLTLRKGIPDRENNNMISTAEAGTMQLELKYLSQLTDDWTYGKAAEKVMEIIRSRPTQSGLVPIFMRYDDGNFMNSAIRFGSRGDSYYEYLLKQYLLTNLSEPVYREMWDEAIGTMHRDLVMHTQANGMLYIAELNPKYNRQTRAYDWYISAKQDHLVCFLGGALLLGVTEGRGPIPPHWDSLSATQKRDWSTGVQLIDTCVQTHNTTTGLSPEIAHFKKPNDSDADSVDWYIKGLSPQFPHKASFDSRYILRPETVESLFYGWRVTGDPKYREEGWKIYQAIEKYCRVEEGGYTSILNVNDTATEREDKMETFFLSETLKYLYLLFSDSSVLPLDKWVFNTEAHPLPVFQPSIRIGHQ